MLARVFEDVRLFHITVAVVCNCVSVFMRQYVYGQINGKSSAVPL